MINTLIFYIWSAIKNPGICSTLDSKKEKIKNYCEGCKVK